MPEDLVAGIRTVASGDAAVAPGITRRLIEAFAHHLPPGRAPTDNRLNQLTTREHQVLDELAKARSNGEIAQRLHITQATVKVHVSRILTKLELHDRAQVVVFAYETGIIQPGTGT